MGDSGEASVSEDHVVKHSVPPVAHVEAIVLAVCLSILGIVSKGPKMCIWPLPSHLKDGQDLHSTSLGSQAHGIVRHTASLMADCSTALWLLALPVFCQHVLLPDSPGPHNRCGISLINSKETTELRDVAITLLSEVRPAGALKDERQNCAP